MESELCFTEVIAAHGSLDHMFMSLYLQCEKEITIKLEEPVVMCIKIRSHLMQQQQDELNCVLDSHDLKHPPCYFLCFMWFSILDP